MTARRTLALIMMLVASTSACGGGAGPGTGPPVNPHPAGEAIEVGHWYRVDTLLVDMNSVVERAGDLQSNGWTVTVVSPGACTIATVVQGKEAICVGLQIHNTSATPGGLSLPDDLPVLADSTGQRATAVDLRIAGSEFVILDQPPGSTSESTSCTFGAPDAESRQQADCTAMVIWSSGDGGVSSGWATVGAGKTATYDLAYVVPAGRTGWGLGWLDGTWFSLP